MTPSARYPDWSERLTEECRRQRQGGAFAYGRRDCCLVTADIVRAMTGWDPAEPLRGAYADEQGAAAVIRRYGGLREMVSELLDRNPQPGNLAARGDVVLLDPLTIGSTEQLGVCIGDAAMVVAECGILTRPRRRFRLCWRID